MPLIYLCGVKSDLQHTKNIFRFLVYLLVYHKMQDATPAFLFLYSLYL